MSDDDNTQCFVWGGGGESFHPTMSLRWVSKEVPTEDGRGVMVVRVLQQLFQGSNGTQSWEDVPDADE